LARALGACLDIRRNFLSMEERIRFNRGDEQEFSPLED
jgi:hypothetical protein